MNYSVSNSINRPFDEVIAKFKEPDGIMNWMEGINKVEHLSGVPGEVGAKAQLHMEHKGKEMQMTETILENRPDGMKFAYDSSMGYNEVDISFERIDDHNTKQTNSSYFRMKGLMKIISVLFKGMFKRQSLKYMEQFKAYAER